MANPASFTINALTRDTVITQPTAQAVDTDGTVPILLATDYDVLLVEVENDAATACTVAVLAGDNPPAARAGKGNLSESLEAAGNAGDIVMIGPLERARFAQDNGTINLSFTKASGSTNCKVIVYGIRNHPTT